MVGLCIQGLRGHVLLHMCADSATLPLFPVIIMLLCTFEVSHNVFYSDLTYRPWAYAVIMYLLGNHSGFLVASNVDHVAMVSYCEHTHTHTHMH